MKYYPHLYFFGLIFRKSPRVFPLFHIAVGLYSHSNPKAMIAVAQTANYFLSFMSVVSLVIIDFRLTRQIHIECQSKHNYIYVIYKVLVYVQTSQPTACFGLFQLGYLQVGHKGQRNYTIMHHYH